MLPVYNGMPYVAAAIESVLSQSFTDFELLVIDDGSTDGSSEVLERYRSSDPRVRLVRRANKGLVATLNEMVAMSRGSLLARMDADDVCLPDRLLHQVAFMEGSPETVALGSRATLMDPEGLLIADFIDHTSHEQIDRALLKPEIGILHPTVMMRRDAVDRVGGYRGSYPHVEDLDLFLRLAEVGRLANLAQALLHYRVHPNSVSHLHAEAQAAAGRLAVAATHERRSTLHERSFDGQAAYGPKTESKGDLHRKWSWWALAAGNLRTARKHALHAVLAEPTRRQNLLLVVCVARDSLLRRRSRADA